MASYEDWWEKWVFQKLEAKLLSPQCFSPSEERCRAEAKLPALSLKIQHCALSNKDISVATSLKYKRNLEWRKKTQDLVQFKFILYEISPSKFILLFLSYYTQCLGNDFFYLTVHFFKFVTKGVFHPRNCALEPHLKYKLKKIINQ